jgi:CDP-diglyceride synthetase
MFKQRAWTTIILLPLVLAFIYYSNNWVFVTALLIIVIGCGFEWLQLIPITHVLPKLLYMIVLIGICYVTQFLSENLLVLSFYLWAAITLAILKYPKSQVIWGKSWVVTVLSLILLPVFSQSLFAIFTFEKGRALLVYLLFLVWASDIGAYLAGKQWGKHKLIPAVSPGKTKEGVLGGSILALLVSLIAGLYIPHQNWILWCSVALLVSVISLIGDLSISMLKRRVQLKDTGSLFPGHGGVLDRLDSLIAATPFFYFMASRVLF